MAQEAAYSSRRVAVIYTETSLTRVGGLRMLFAYFAKPFLCCVHLFKLIWCYSVLCFEAGFTSLFFVSFCMFFVMLVRYLFLLFSECWISGVLFSEVGFYALCITRIPNSVSRFFLF